MNGEKWEIGEDGLPTSPDHPSNRDKRTVEQVREDVFAREVEYCERAWADGGSPSILLAVITLCRVPPRPLPVWAADGLQRLIAAGEFRRKRGRLGNTKANDRQNRIHYERWDRVVEIKDRWNETRGRGGGRFSLEKAYAEAAEKLREEKSEAAGNDEAIRKSCQLVERLFRSGKGARFHIP